MTRFRCFLIRRPASATAAASAAAHHHGIRHARRVRRAAAVIVCVSIGSAAASLAPYLLSPPYPPAYGGGPSALGDASAERPWIASPDREGQTIPEPASLALLATAVAAMAALRKVSVMNDDDNEQRNYLTLTRPDCPECGKDKLALIDVERERWKCRECGARFEGKET